MHRNSKIILLVLTTTSILAGCKKVKDKELEGIWDTYSYMVDKKPSNFRVHLTIHLKQNGTFDYSWKKNTDSINVNSIYQTNASYQYSKHNNNLLLNFKDSIPLTDTRYFYGFIDFQVNKLNKRELDLEWEESGKKHELLFKDPAFH